MKWKSCRALLRMALLCRHWFLTVGCGCHLSHGHMWQHRLYLFNRACVEFRNTYFLTLATPKYLFVKFILCRYFCLSHEVAVLTTVDLGSVAVFVVLVVLVKPKLVTCWASGLPCVTCLASCNS